MNFRLVLAFCVLPFVLSACQTSQVASSSFAGQSLSSEPVKGAVQVENIPLGAPANQSASAEDEGRPGSSKIAKKTAKSDKYASVPKTDINDQLTTSLTRGDKSSAAESAIEKVSAKSSAKKKRSSKRKSSKRRSSKRITVAEGRRKYRSIIAKHARAQGVPLKLAMAVVEIESSYRVNARGSAGEIGLMQLLPATARFIGYKGKMKSLYHPDTNIKYGMKYLGKAHRLGGGKLCGTILKYNAGHGAKRMNRISRTYCNRIKRLMRRS